MYKYLVNLWFILSCFPLLAVTNEVNSDPILQIDQEITILKKKIQQITLKKANEDVESQEYMIANWEKYSDEMEDVRDLQIQEQELLEQIKALEAKKAQILKKRPKYG